MITYRKLGQVGRLGNQLFQLAATIGIARDAGEDPVFPADWMYRPFFCIPDELFAEEIPPDAKESTIHAQHLDPRCRNYLQDWGLFSHHLDEILEYLQPSSAAYHDLWQYVGWPRNGCIGVHVRRGDNVFDPGVPNKSDYHPVPPLHYYQRGIKMFDEADVACFSDDVPWCRSHIPAIFYGQGKPYLKEHEPGYGIVEPHDWLDLFLLSRCRYFVITGSTFGIWGAILAGARADEVVRPDAVYGRLLSHINSELLFDPSWRVLKCF